jgi:hypothetical protein
LHLAHSLKRARRTQFVGLLAAERFISRRGWTKRPAFWASIFAPTATGCSSSAWGSYVTLKDFDDWFASFLYGRRLGCTLGVLSALGFLLFRALACVEDDMAKTSTEQRKLPPPGQLPAPLLRP